MNEDNLLNIYNFLGGEEKIGPKDLYLSKMQDEETARKFYNDFSSDIGGNEDAFLQHIKGSVEVEDVEVEVVEPKEEVVAEPVPELDPSKMITVSVDGQDLTIPETDQPFIEDYYSWKEETSESIDKDIKNKYLRSDKQPGEIEVDSYVNDGPEGKSIPEDLYESYMAELGQAKQDLNWENYIQSRIDGAVRNKTLAITDEDWDIKIEENLKDNPQPAFQPYSTGASGAASSDGGIFSGIASIIASPFQTHQPIEEPGLFDNRMIEKNVYPVINKGQEDEYTVDNFESLQQYAKDNKLSLPKAFNRIKRLSFEEATLRSLKNYHEESAKDQDMFGKIDGRNTAMPAWLMQASKKAGDANRILNSDEFSSESLKPSIGFTEEDKDKAYLLAEGKTTMDINSQNVFEATEADKNVFNSFSKLYAASQDPNATAEQISALREDYDKLWGTSSWAEDGGQKLLDYNTGEYVLEQDASDEIKNWNERVKSLAEEQSKKGIDQSIKTRNEAYFRLLESINEMAANDDFKEGDEYKIGQTIGLQTYAMEGLKALFGQSDAFSLYGGETPSSKIMDMSTSGGETKQITDITKTLSKLPGNSKIINNYNNAYDQFVVADKALKLNIDPLTLDDQTGLWGGIKRFAEGFTKTIAGEVSGEIDDMYIATTQAYEDAVIASGGTFSKKGLERKVESGYYDDYGNPTKNTAGNLGNMTGFLVNFFIYKSPFKAIGAINKLGKISSIDKYRRATLSSRPAWLGGTTRVANSKTGRFATNFFYNGVNEGMLMGGHAAIADYQVKGQHGMGPVEGFIIGSTGYAAQSFVKWLTSFSPSALKAAPNLNRLQKFNKIAEETIKKATYPVLKNPLAKNVIEKGTMSALQSQGFLLAEVYDKFASQEMSMGEAFDSTFLNPDGMSAWEKQKEGFMMMAALNFFSRPAFKSYLNDAKLSVKRYRAPKDLKNAYEQLGATENEVRNANQNSQDISNWFLNLKARRLKEIKNGAKDNDLSIGQKDKIKQLLKSIKTVKNQMAYETVRDGIKGVEGNMVNEKNADREMFYFTNRIINNSRNEGFSMDYEDAKFLDGLPSTQLNYVNSILQNAGLGTESANAFKVEATRASGIMNDIRNNMPEGLYKKPGQAKKAFDKGLDYYTELSLRNQLKNKSKKSAVDEANLEKIELNIEVLKQEYLQLLALDAGSIEQARKLEKANALTGVSILSNSDFLNLEGGKELASGFYQTKDGKIYINREFAAAARKFNVISHEILHPILEKQFTNVSVKEIMKELSLDFEEAKGYKLTLNTEANRLTEEFLNSLSSKEKSLVEENIDKNYRFLSESEAKDGLADGSIIPEDLVNGTDAKGNVVIKDGKVELKKHMFADETIIAYSDLITSGDITPNMDKGINIGSAIKQALNRYLPRADFSSGQEVYKFIVEYGLKAKEGKTSGETIKRLKQAETDLSNTVKYSISQEGLSNKAKEFKELEKEGIYTEQMYVDMVKSKSTNDADRAAAIELLVENNFGNIQTNGFRGKIIVNTENAPRLKQLIVDQILGIFPGRNKPLFENYDKNESAPGTWMANVLGKRTPEILTELTKTDRIKDSSSIEGREDMKNIADPTPDPVSKDFIEIKMIDILDANPVSKNKEKIESSVQVSESEKKSYKKDPLAFKEISDKYAPKIGEIIFDVPSDKINNSGNQLTYEDGFTHQEDFVWKDSNGSVNEKKSSKAGDVVNERTFNSQSNHSIKMGGEPIKGIPTKSESGKIQNFFNIDRNIIDLLKQAPDFNTVSEQITIGKKGEPTRKIETDLDVRGISLNISNNLSKILYEPVINPKTGKQARSRGKSTQTPLIEKRPEMYNPGKAEIAKVKKALGITSEGKKYDRAIGQNLKGAARLYSDIVTQRVVGEKVGGTPAEQARYKVKKSKRSYQLDKEFAGKIKKVNLENINGFGNFSKELKKAGFESIKSRDKDANIVDPEGINRFIEFLKKPATKFFNSPGFFSGGTLTNSGGKNMYLKSAERQQVLDSQNFTTRSLAYDKMTKSSGLDPVKSTIGRLENKLFKKNANLSKEGLGDIINSVYEALKENSNYLPEIVSMFDKASASNQHFWRNAAKVIGKQKNWRTHGEDATGVGEHVMPQNEAAEFVLKSALRALKNPNRSKEIINTTSELLKNNYFQFLMSVRNDNLVGAAGHKSSMPEGFWNSWNEAIKTGDVSKAWSIWSRYFSKELNKLGNEINPNELDMYDMATDKVANLADLLGIGKKVYGDAINSPDFVQAQQDVIGGWSRREAGFQTIAERQAYLNQQAKITLDKNKATKATANEIGNRLFSVDRNGPNSKMIEEAKVFDMAIEKSNLLDMPEKKIRVFDFDDTIAKSKSLVFYNKANESGKPTPTNKAIFMIGGPGSGKTNIGKGLQLGRDGFKVVNQDIFVEAEKTKQGLPEIEKNYSPEQRSARAKIGADAQKAAKGKLEKYTKAGNGMVIDGTGASYNATMKKVNALKQQGYEVFMVHAKTSSEIALERNRARKERSLSDNIVRKTTESVNNNIEKYEKDLGNNFIQIDTETIDYGKPLPTDFVSKVKQRLYATERGRLNAEEFARDGKKLVDEGFVMDFSDFNIVREGEKGPLFDVAKKIKEARGNEDLFILTARAPESREAIYEFLKKEGLEFKKDNIVGLGNSTGEAKARWLVEKASEGFNDFYFADDALKNVEAVKEAMSQLDVKSKVQQAKVRYSLDLDKQFNEILEAKSGIESFKEFSEAKARVIGSKNGKRKFWIPYSAEDYLGLIYPTLGKGKVGDAQLKWYKKELITPYNKAMENLSKDRLQLMQDFRLLKKSLKVPKNLRKKTNSGFTNEQAVRVYLWEKTGQKVEGLSKTDLKELTDIVNSSAELKTFADQILTLTKGDGYSKPGSSWLNGTITTDLIDVITKTKRGKYLTEWKQKKEVVYSKKNMNKLEAIYGPKYREALENILTRMETGKNRIMSGSRLSNVVLDYINGSNAAIMFFNTRSALLQTISSINFVNWGFNNPVAAGKAMLNQPQFWKDFGTLINSNYLKDRRNGLRLNIAESEIADAASTSKNKAKAALQYIQQKGYLPTQYADSFAIAFGGATYYRNRIKDLIRKEGKSKEQAEKQALSEWREISEESQQSSDPSKISAQQSSDAGRLILMFGNTPMQYARIQKRAFQDIVNGRGDAKTNAGKIAYYAFVQNLIFNGLQQAMFAVGFGDGDDTEAADKKKIDVANGMLDSQLRGLGMAGVAVSVTKNFLKDLYDRSKRSRPEYADAIYKLLQFSPPISSKLSRIRAAAWQFDSKQRRQEMFDKGFSIDNPAYRASAKVLSATTNIPLDRLFSKYDNIQAAMQEENDWWMSVAELAGWPEWQLKPKKGKSNNKSSVESKKSSKVKLYEDPFKSNNKKDPFKSNGEKDPFKSNNEEDPFKKSSRVTLYK